MPINPKLKEQLEKTQMDEKYRASLIAMLEDAPAPVQNLWMSQEDYTRQSNALKAEKADWDVKNKDFYAKSNASIDAWKEEVKKANDAVAASQARIAELEAAGGTGVGGSRTPQEEDAITKEIAKLSTGITTIQDRLKQVVTPEDLNKRYQDAVGFIGDQILTINEIQATHIEKFGKRMTKDEITELIKFTNEMGAKGKNMDLVEAYDLKNKDAIKELERAQWEKEYAEKHKTISEVPGGAGPGGPGPAGKGPLEIRLDQERVRATGGTGDKGYATWQEAAAAAGNELVSEGKF